MKALTRKLIGDMLHLRGPIIAVALVVACGIAMLVSMVSIHASLTATRDAYYDRYDLADLFAGVRRAPRSVAARIAALGGVERCEDRIVVDVTLDVPGLAEPATGRLISIPERQRAMLNGVHLRAGRYIDAGEPDGVIASEAFASANELRLGDAVDATINGRWRRLTVVGIGLSPEYTYEVAPGMMFPDNRRFGVLWMGRDALAGAFDMAGAFNDLAIRLGHDADAEEVRARVDRLLADFGGLGTLPRSEVLSVRMLDDELRQIVVNAFIVPVIFLGVAMFLLHNMLVRLIATQREKIAALKAFGYSDWSVGLHYLSMSLVVVLLGTLTGLAVGVWLGTELSGLYTNFYHFPVFAFRLGWGSLALGVLLSVAAAAVGALGAVRSAVSMPPAEAMRPASPDRYRKLLAERLGLERFLSNGVRMVLRSLERRPLKSLSAILGIAMAVAILILGRFSFDALDLIRDHQFRTIQRERAMTVFTSPRPRRALDELGALPGVLRAEPFRLLPVRVHVAHRSRRLALVGLDERSELRRIVGAEGRAQAPDAYGLTMTSFLADELDVRRGDVVTVELLDGSRRSFDIAVIDLVDELIGVSLYVERHALDRFAGTSELISGAYLLTDPFRSAELYERLKHTPGVASTTVRSATIAGFDRTISESQGMSSIMVAIFALVIAVGVIYNGARISLSERGRELASLRVLGFTRGEVAALLLGEQAVLIVVAIPVGFLLGYLFCWMIVESYQTEMYRMPLTLSGGSFAYTFLVIAGAALFTGLLIRRRIDSLDLVEVLKTRE